MENPIKRIINRIVTSQNSTNLARQFLRYGNTKMLPKWSEVEMTDQDHYKGYVYAAIENRANKTASLATEGVYTKSIIDGGYVHPYLEAISESSTFSDYMFWFEISTYLDLEGVYYLMAVRDYTGDTMTDVKEFKLLNPYDINRIVNSETLSVGGYLERRNGAVREIPPHMIIEIRKLNPFDRDVPYAPTDAAAENQFVLRTANNYTRESLNNNVNAPGILSTDVLLKPHEFDNFVSAVRNHEGGEPIFGNGSGAVKWESMNVELSKAALRDVNEINREPLFAVLGVSKTTLGIEQSGVTRETGRVQTEKFVTDHILPRTQLILDALNQDYRNNYPNDYTKTMADIKIDNPYAYDVDADKARVALRTQIVEAIENMVSLGYDRDESEQYITGKLDANELTPPKETPTTPPPAGDQTAQKIAEEMQKSILELGRLINTGVRAENKKINERKNKVNEKQREVERQINDLADAIN